MFGKPDRPQNEGNQDPQSPGPGDASTGNVQGGTGKPDRESSGPGGLTGLAAFPGEGTLLPK